MSRLAFDDIFKPSPSLGPSDSHASRKSSKRTKDLSLFNDTFKQAVKELDTNDLSSSDEKFDANTNDVETSGDLSEKGKSQISTSDTGTADRGQKSSVDTSDEPTSDELALESSDQEEDDALIARVMAEAAEHGKEVGLLDSNTEGKAASNGTSATASTGNLTDQATNTSQEMEASIITTDASTEATTSGMLQANLSEQASITSSEMVTEASSEATQATVSTTGIAAEAETTNGNLTPEAAAANVLQESNTQRKGSDKNQEGESESSQKPQASALNLNTPAAEGEELKVKTTELKKETAATTTKVGNLHERSAATMGQETRPAQGASSNPASQNTEPTVDTTDRVRFVERVAQAFQAQSKENGTIRMRLHPEELGSLKIEITIRNGTMHARVETETQEARNVLMENLPALRDRLATHNIKVEQFEIDYNAGGDQQNLPHDPEDWTDSGRNGSNDSNRNLSSEEVDTTETSIRQAASVTGSGEQLDVTV